MKKAQVIGVVVLTLFSVLLMSNLVAARSPIEDLKAIGEGVFKAFKPLFEAVLGEVPGEEYLFAKVLFFVIVLSIVWVALSRVDFFTEYELAHWGVALAASILAIRWIGGTSMIETIILPYSTLGIALSAAIPFVLWFFVVNVGLADARFRVVRRIAWIFFAIIFIGLWYSRYDLIIAETGNEALAGYIYPSIAILSIIMILLDGTLQRFRNKLLIEKIGKDSAVDAITEVKRKIADLPDLLASGVITAKERDAQLKHYHKQIVDLSK